MVLTRASVMKGGMKLPIVPPMNVTPWMTAQAMENVSVPTRVIASQGLQARQTAVHLNVPPRVIVRTMAHVTLARVIVTQVGMVP